MTRATTKTAAPRAQAAAKKPTQRTQAAAKKPASRPQAPAKKTPPKYEETETGITGGRIATAIVLYGLALLSAYLLIIPQEPTSKAYALRRTFCCLGGSLAILIPVFFGWIATQLILSTSEQKLSAVTVLSDALLFPVLFTAAQLFTAPTVIATRMERIHTFANFVAKSYDYAKGGGAIGALLAWPLYKALGVAGGFIVILVIVALLLTVTGRAAKLWVSTSGIRAFISDLFGSAADRKEQKRAEAQAAAEADDDLKRMDRAMQSSEEEPIQSAPNKRRSGRVEMDPSQADVSVPVRRKSAPNADAGTSHAKMKPLKRSGKPLEEDWSEGDPVVHLKRNRPEKRRPAPDVHAPNEEEEIDEIFRVHPDTASEFNSGDIYEPDPAVFRRSKTVRTSNDNRRKASPPTDEGSAPTVEESVADVQQAPIPEAPPVVKGDAQPDYTIEPDESEVFSGAEEPEEPAPTKPAMPKLKRSHTPQPDNDGDDEVYFYPPIDLLAEGTATQSYNRDADMEKAELLVQTLSEFGINTKLTGIAHGPAVTRFELQPAPGIKLSRISALSDDIAMRLAAMSVRIEAPIPGKAAVGVEIPNEKIEMVRLRDVLESNEARNMQSRIAVGLGKDNSGRYIVADIAKMPHVLIAGQTGSGKSVCINSIISSILYRATPKEVRLILIDPKVVELSIYNDIPHLICPVVTEPKKAASALAWAVGEMKSRYDRFEAAGVRDIKGFNKAVSEEERMPQIVIVIDELADLMMVSPGEVEDSICRLAQLARACGMHLVIATQRPSVNVITGIIKANIPTRIAFSVASQVDSRTMIDHGGAEKLLGNGDMLFVPPGISKAMRVQGAWVSDEEVHSIVNYIRARSSTSYNEDMIEQMNNSTRSDAEKEEIDAEYDPLLPKAIEIVVEAGQASVSMLQRRMRVGYAHAGRLIDEMEMRGIVSPGAGSKSRQVLISREDLDSVLED